MSWPTGIVEVRKLISEGAIERVIGDLEESRYWLQAAKRHLDSSSQLASSDPEGAYSLLYDAARKSLVAVLAAQGLRATTRGGHIAIEAAVRAQFTTPPPSTAFRIFQRLRVNRNSSEYQGSSAIDSEAVLADHEAVVRLHLVAGQLVQNLPLFTD